MYFRCAFHVSRGVGFVLVSRLLRTRLIILTVVNLVNTLRPGSTAFIFDRIAIMYATNAML